MEIGTAVPAFFRRPLRAEGARFDGDWPGWGWPKLRVSRLRAPALLCDPRPRIGSPDPNPPPQGGWGLLFAPMRSVNPTAERRGEWTSGGSRWSASASLA